MKAINPYKIGGRILKRSDKILYWHIYNKFKTGNNEFPVIKRAKGPYLYDFDQNRYIDFFMLGGNLLMGHVVQKFTKTVKSWFNRGYSAGYPFLQSSRLLAKKLGNLINVYNQDDYLIVFFNSSYEALINTLFLVKSIGLKHGGYITGQFAKKDFETIGIENALQFDVKGRYDYLILKPTVPEILEKANLVIKKDQRKSIVTILDERDFPAVYYQFISDKWIDADIRILGSWGSSGYDFGAIVIKKKILASFYQMDYSLLYYLNDYRFPPLYKIKGAIEYLSILNKKGGISKVIDLQHSFMEKIKNPYFIMQNGLIFINDKVIKDFSDYWYKMLIYGYYMPYNLELPVFIPIGYDLDMIKRVTKDLNKIMIDL